MLASVCVSLSICLSLCIHQFELALACLFLYFSIRPCMAMHTGLQLDSRRVVCGCRAMGTGWRSAGGMQRSMPSQQWGWGGGASPWRRPWRPAPSPPWETLPLLCAASRSPKTGIGFVHCEGAAGSADLLRVQVWVAPFCITQVCTVCGPVCRWPLGLGLWSPFSKCGPASRTGGSQQGP